MMNSLQSQRFDLRKSLWNKRHHVSAQDSFDCVKVLSPSLTNCLLQRTTQDRTVYLYLDETDDQMTEALEKMTFYLYSENINLNNIQAAQPYLRSSMIDKSIVHSFMQHSSQPRLRFIQIFDDVKLKVLESKVIHKFGPQLQSLEVSHAIFPFVLISTVDAMSRLKILKIDLCQKPTVHMVQPNVERIIPWHQLSVFSLRCIYIRYIFECAQLLEQLGQMTQLRKLSIELSYRDYWNQNMAREHFEAEEINQFLTVKLGAIPKFPKLEVLRFAVEADQEDNILDYRFLVGLLVPKLSATLTKLIFRMPRSLESNSIFLDYSNEFPHLETLVVDYQHLCGDSTFLDLYESEDKRTPSQSIRHLTIANYEGYGFSYSKIFQQIPAIFPNLVELNFEPLSLKSSMDTCYCRVNEQLTDSDLMEMINRLPHLSTLRFMDDYPKFRRLVGSIELMCKRATELKPKVPMLFRVPLGNDFEFLKYSNDQLPEKLKDNFFFWDKAVKWIRLC